MRRAIAAAEAGHPSGVDRVESDLLGTLIICPFLRLDCETLKPTDFKSPFRGAAFAAIMAVKHPELALVAAHLEAAGEPAPPSRTGWVDALSRVVDHTFLEEDAIRDAIRVIRDAAVSRRLATIMGRQDAA